MPADSALRPSLVFLAHALDHRLRHEHAEQRIGSGLDGSQVDEVVFGDERRDGVRDGPGTADESSIRPCPLRVSDGEPRSRRTTS
jgi:hypothetical protein